MKVLTLDREAVEVSHSIVKYALLKPITDLSSMSVLDFIEDLTSDVANTREERAFREDLEHLKRLVAMRTT